MSSQFKKLVWLIIAAPVLYLIFIWNKLPEKVPMHFDMKGNADRMGSKTELIISAAILTVVNIGVYLLLTNIHRIDPKKNAPENKERMNKIAFFVSLFLSIVLCILIHSSQQTNIQWGIKFIFIGIGLLYTVIGNYMPNMKPNYFAGLRLPWTLENEDNWRKTHAMAGKYWFFGGMAIALICFFVPSQISFFILMGGTLILVLVPSLFSYRLYKLNKHKRDL